ncbi:hypothetical protein MPTK1_5g12030 [Marchantia polymorpha subsp. ruderalis]|uniref:Uncharacterized protein n=2 Tax=Marchantia polymorpha TaxID=3197 RepID=A0AAF6BHH1_MARPO|nr:hypothetical protein MARPO_0143s0032 [Marchantia polymorpha]BBN11455.1 hypothetical protein Mp_5g12030 [Marchantia polymorpha subsp. ruderalis]|eukprot:PTQ29354.1 hypothetical protein MARPO_0143s0032 [Marchantia polymorpha]
MLIWDLACPGTIWRRNFTFHNRKDEMSQVLESVYSLTITTSFPPKFNESLISSELGARKESKGEESSHKVQIIGYICSESKDPSEVARTVYWCRMSAMMQKAGAHVLL